MHPASADEMTGYRSERGKTPGHPAAPWRPLTRPLIAPINGHQVGPAGRRRAPGRGAGPGSQRGRMPAATVRHSAAFRLLALCPGPEVTTGLAATVLDVSPPPAQKLLEKLVMAGLIEPAGCDWWRFHDLAYHHTQEQVQGMESGSVVRAVTSRILSWYVGAAIGAHADLPGSGHAQPVTSKSAVPHGSGLTSAATTSSQRRCANLAAYPPPGAAGPKP